MKNVVFFINSLGRGGAEKALIQILERINTNKYKIKLVVIKNDGGYINQVPKNVELISLGRYEDNLFSKVRWSIYWRIIRYFPTIIKKQILRKVNIHKNDLLVSFLEGQSTKLVSLFLNRKIAWMHTDYQLNRWTTEFFKSANEELNDYNKFNSIVFVSKHGQEAFNNFFNQKVTRSERVIYNPIDVQEINELANCEADDVSNWVSKTENTIRIVSIGRLTDVKRMDWLIDAHDQLNRLGILVSTTVIGTGKLYEDFQKIIVDRDIKGIYFVGFKTNPYVYLKYADIYTSTSLTESYPLSIAEAYALEVPVIATRNSGSNELSREGKYALLVDSNYTAFFEALKNIITDNSLLDNYKIKAIEAKKQFDVGSVLEDIENLLDEVFEYDE
ncbi:glycosyltransferase [Latilactobacillus curvatus]|uniref:glycosyltransferase n=1 Tax=Latilactobacillus curvatus TaxID=28038 RepID=UPI0020C82AD1|nr:glycosyltransferase [Latilactobacillus curvatus]MCP8850484.1 glycosyltransferase [Latilactobacillus curvatus]